MSKAAHFEQTNLHDGICTVLIFKMYVHVLLDVQRLSLI